MAAELRAVQDFNKSYGIGIYEDIYEDEDRVTRSKLFNMAAEPETGKPAPRELRAVQEFEALHGISSESSMIGISDHATRSTLSNIVPIVVNQEDGETCAFVSLAKVLTYNLLGLVMDITLSPEEKDNLDDAIKNFNIDIKRPVSDRDFHKYYTPKNCSIKGFTLIAMFFYFFDFAQKNDLKPDFYPGDRLRIVHKPSMKSYDQILNDILFPFLKLNIKRFGGVTPVAAGWIDSVTEDLSPKVEELTWQKVSLCTFTTKYCFTAQTLQIVDFQRFCDEVIFKFTKKLKIIITLSQHGSNDLHDVVLMSKQKNDILISNSWGESVDRVNIASFPIVKLNVPGGSPLSFLAFQYTFLLPMTPLMVSTKKHNMQPQYYAEDFELFMTGMTEYISLMSDLDNLKKISPTVLEKIAQQSRNFVGGKRNKRSKRKRFRYTRNIKRSKKMN
jgi:hypothetical protein